MTSLSFLASSFASNILLLCITLGVGVGCGSGLITLVNYAIIPCYFEQRLAMATGVSRVGNGVYTYFAHMLMHELKFAFLSVRFPAWNSNFSLFYDFNIIIAFLIKTHFLQCILQHQLL